MFSVESVCKDETLGLKKHSLRAIQVLYVNVKN